MNRTPIGVHVLGGTLFGAVAGWSFLPALLSADRILSVAARFGWRLEPADTLWIHIALGAALGAIAGLIGAPFWSAREAHRARQADRAAAAVGGSRAPQADAETSERLRKDFPSLDAGLEGVARKELSGASLAVGELWIRSESGSLADSKTTIREQTAAYYVCDTLRQPSFRVQPESAVLNFAMKFAFGGVNLGKIEFPGHAEFASAYQVSGVHVDNIRRLLDDSLIQAMVRTPGLRIESVPGSVLIFRPGKRVSPEALPQFIAETDAIFALIRASAQKHAQAAELSPTPKPDARALAGKVPGVVGEYLREQMVTRSEVDDFVRQPPPREIAGPILGYCDRLAPRLVVFLGLGFATAGAFFAFVFGPKQLGGMLFGLLFVAIGAPLAFFLGRAHLRMRRLLSRGELGVGRIGGLEDTGMTVSGAGQVFKVTLRHQANGQSYDTSCRISGHAVERARRLAADGKPVPILYDPADPRRVLLVEDLRNADPELEA